MSPGIPAYVTGVTPRMMVCSLRPFIDPVSTLTDNYQGTKWFIQGSTRDIRQPNPYFQTGFNGERNPYIVPKQHQAEDTSVYENEWAVKRPIDRSKIHSRIIRTVGWFMLVCWLSGKSQRVSWSPWTTGHELHFLYVSYPLWLSIQVDVVH